MFTKKQYWKEQTRWRNIKKENSKIWSEKEIDTLINCFQSHECLWNVTSGDYKDQNRKSLALEEIDMSMQEFEINRYDYQKSGLISEANSYEIITDKITQRTVVVVQMKCFNQLGNGINNKIFWKVGKLF